MTARILSIVLTVVVAAAAMTLSFAALSDLAAANLADPGLAPLFPILVDGTIIAATVSTVTLTRKWFSWLTLIGAAAVSIAGNAIHAYPHGGIAVAIAVVPPVALLALTQILIEHRREHTVMYRGEDVSEVRPPKPEWTRLRDAVATPDLTAGWPGSPKTSA